MSSSGELTFRSIISIRASIPAFSHLTKRNKIGSLLMCELINLTQQSGTLRYWKMLAIILAIVAIPQSIPAQAKMAKEPFASSQAFKSSPAYAEVLLRRTELESELESLIIDYTEEFPKVKEIRQTLGYLKRESDRLAIVKPADASKLTLALGKLIVRKVELETDVWNLMRTYNEAHPEVKRAKRKVEIYEAAIKEILG
jgi:hypothetical protein